MTDYPLSLPWERAAAKELADCLHFLTHGMFQDYDDCCDRIETAAERIRETVAFHAGHNVLRELIEADCQQHPQSQDDDEVLGDYLEAIDPNTQTINPPDEPSRFPHVNQDDPNKPGTGDQF